MRNLDKMLLIMVLVLAVTVTILSQASADEQTLTVIVYTEDGKKLPGAIVELDGQRDTTDSNGEAEFQINTTDTYQIKVYYPSGYKVFEDTISNYTKSTFRANASVVSEWTISIKDGKGRDPVPNANVTIVLRDNNSVKYSKLTDSNGKVTFGPIPSREYDVTVKYKDIEREFDHKKPEVIEEEVETLNLNLPLYRATITVKDRKGVPVKDVEVELRPELDEEPIASAVSDADGKAVFKLIPNGKYYVLAYLKDIKVYESDTKEISISNNDDEETITINAARLNITVYDYDGRDKIEEYALKGELSRNGELIGEAETTDGVLRFGHMPFADYTLKIFIGDLKVYSGAYELQSDTVEGSVKAWFYDVEIRINASALVNETIAKALKGELTRGSIRLEFQTEEGKAELTNVPRAEDYVATLYYGNKKIGEIHDVKILEENQIVKLNLTGYEIKITTLNLDGEPISADISILLPDGGQVVSFKTDENGVGSSGTLLPLTYKIEAFLGGIKVGDQSLTLSSNMNVQMQLSVMNLLLRILDRDGESVLNNIDLQLIHGSFKRTGKSDQDGSIVVKNVPLEEYRIIVNYHGFKVLDRLIEVSSEAKEMDLKAPGVLDARLLFLDSMKNPLDQGSVILSFGDVEVEKEIDANGGVVAKNLPNITIGIKAYYKGVEVDTNPRKFDLLKDEMKVTVIAAVHKITAKVLRGDGEPVKEGEALIYVNDKLKATYDLKADNTFSDRLPEGDVKIQIIYRNRSAGSMEIYLEQPMENLAVYSTLFPFHLEVYDPEGKPVEGAELILADKFGEIDRTKSDEKGVIQTVLPVGVYEGSLKIENQTYSFGFELRNKISINFLYPVSHNHGFEIAIAAGALNLVISGFALSKVPRRKPSVERAERRGRRTRRIRRVPRV